MSEADTIHVHDVDLHYRRWGTGPNLLLLHGFTGSGDDFRHLFDLEALGLRYRVLAPDLRGHGRSANPAGVFTHRQCAEDVAALLDALGVARCRALGISLGGNTLLHLARERPDLVESMVVVSATPSFPDCARRLMREAAARTPSPGELAALHRIHPLGEQQIDALRRQNAAFAESTQDMNLTSSEIAAIRARTLVVQGDRDPLYPLELSLELHRHLPDSALWVIPEAGHCPVFGEWREEFAARALSFLR